MVICSVDQSFSDRLPGDRTPWVWDRYGPDSPWEAGELDDDGDVFRNSGGQPFRDRLDTFRDPATQRASTTSVTTTPSS